MRLPGFALACLLGIEIPACAPESSVSRVLPVAPARVRVGSDAAVVAADSSGAGAAGAVAFDAAFFDAGAMRRDDARRADTAAPDRSAPPVEGGQGSVVVAAAVDAAAADASVDGAPTACQPGTCKRVFISSRAMANGGLVSLGAADAACTMLAMGANLGGAWRAWLSDALSAPANRFSRANMPHALVDGTRVAASWAALTSGTLEHAIDVFETGGSIPAGQTFEVWTGTSPEGMVSGATCGNWTNNSPGLPNGDVGISNRRDRGWTQAYAQTCDRTSVHLYCFEQ